MASSASAPSPAADCPPQALRLARVMAAMTAFCLIGDTMLYIALPLCWRQCGLDALWQVGVLLAVNRLVRLPLNPLVRRLYARISRRTGMLLAVLLAAGTTLLYAVAQSFAVWLLLRCLWGLAWTLLRLGALFALAEASDKANRGYLMGSYNGLVRLGSLAGMLGGGLLADLFGFAAVASLFGAISLLGLLPGLCWLPAGERPTAAQGREAGTLLVRRHLRLPAMRRIFATGFLVTLVFQGIYAASLSRMVALHVGTWRWPGGWSWAAPLWRACCRPCAGAGSPGLRRGSAACRMVRAVARPCCASACWPGGCPSAWWPCRCPCRAGWPCCSFRRSAPPVSPRWRTRRPRIRPCSTDIPP